MTAQDNTNDLELSLLETDLGDRYGFARAYQGREHPDVGSHNRSLLRRWLILKGVPESKAVASTDRVLGNAYRGGDGYVRKMIEGDDESSPYKRKRYRGNTNAVDLGPGFSPGEQVRGQPLDKLLGLDPKPTPEPDDGGWNDDQDAPAPASTPNAPLQGPTPALDTKAIARAVDSALAPRLEAAKQELRRQSDQQFRDLRDQNTRFKSDLIDATEQQVETKLAMALDALALTDRLKGEITSVALAAAQDFVDRMVPKRLEIRLPDGGLRELPAEPRHKVFDEIFQLLAAGEHVYMVGNAGTGKTFLFKQLAAALGRPLTPLGQALTKYEFSGHIGPTGEYVRTLLRTAVEEGHLLALDEIDMSAAAAIGFLNSLTANRYVAFPDRVVEAHPNFMVIAAANTYGRGATAAFVGRNPLDAASLDRFAYVEVGYDHDLEVQIYGDTPWLRYVHKVRAVIEDQKLKHIVSARAILRGLRCLEANMDPDRVCEVALWRGLEPDTISKIKAQVGTFGQRLRKVA